MSRTSCETLPNEPADSSCSPHNFLIEGELQQSHVKVAQVWIHFQNCLVPLGSLFLIIIIFPPTDVSTAADLNAGTALIKIDPKITLSFGISLWDAFVSF